MNAINTLQCDFKCPSCGHKVESGIGFRAGVVNNSSMAIGDRLSWTGKTWPAVRPEGGNFKTIGYFECENLKCPTWSDCFPQVQEVVITITDDTIAGLTPIFYRPDQQNFDVFTLDQEIK